MACAVKLWTRTSPPTGQLLSTLERHPNIKLLFLCSPGNPTGTQIDIRDVVTILRFQAFKGLVVVDEAYIDFAAVKSGDSPESAVSLLKNYPNLCVLQTMSKSFGLAGIRYVFSVEPSQQRPWSLPSVRLASSCSTNRIQPTTHGMGPSTLPSH